MSTSHEWARDLQKTAEFLFSKEDVEIGNIPVTHYGSYSSKEPFLKLVRALKPGRKTTSQYYVNFFPTGVNLELSINRDLVCHRINPEYECEPLLSKEEDAEMEASV